MMRRFIGDARATTSLEFALVAPVFVVFLFGGLVLGIAVWQRNVLQDVAVEAARCIAVAGSACTTAQPGCSGGASACFVVLRAKERGVANLQANQVSVNPNAVVNGTAFTTVSVLYSLDLAGYSVPLIASASFPNGG